MRRPPRLVLAALLLLPLVGAACGGGGSPATPTEKGAVDVLDNRFNPKEIDVSVGDTVTWTFKGAVNHNVNGPGFTSKTVKKGTFAHQLNSAGSYEYVCTIHQGMKGKVVVS